jgi:signal peptide peptidase SppA
MINIPESIFSQPLAMLPTAIPAFVQRFANLRAKAEAMPKNLTIGDFVNQRKDYAVSDGIATIHVNDVLAQNTTGIDRMLGMTDYGQVTEEIGRAMSDPNVSAVVLEINSPGGSAIGAPEAAQAVKEARNIKPVVAHVGEVGASAAYYIAAGASAIVTQGSGMIGSIGTRIQFLDFAGALSAMGITPHIFTPAQSDLKAAGNELRSPTPAETAWFQEHIESINAAFTGFVKENRPQVKDSAMRGQVVTGYQSIEAGLADYIGSMSMAREVAKEMANYLTTRKSK